MLMGSVAEVIASLNSSCLSGCLFTEAE